MITKTVEITIDSEIAKMMLTLAGYYIPKDISDNSLFALAMQQIDCYGVSYKIISNKDIIKIKETENEENNIKCSSIDAAINNGSKCKRNSC